MTDSNWVLRCAITGEPFASQTETPENPEFPVIWNESECYWVIWNESECYWALETATKTECEICSQIGGYCGHCDGSHWS